MPRHERTGNRKPREHLANQRVPKLGYYFIVTDTKETEQNYMYGLRDSIPKELQGKLVIKVVKTKTKNLVEEAINLASLNPQYGETWIIFDRDQVQDFDEIISQAKAKGIKFGRPRVEPPDNFSEIVNALENKVITTKEAMQQSGMAEATFYRRLREYRKRRSETI